MTETKAEARTTRAANFGFAALLFVLFDWANLEVLLLTTNAGIRSQLLTNALGVYLSIFAYCRCRSWRGSLALSGLHLGHISPRKLARFGVPLR